MGNVVWVLYQILYAFQQCLLRFDNVTESLKVGLVNVLTHSVYT